MSKLAGIKSFLNDLCQANLTDFFKLPDTLVMEDNTNVMLEKGYAVNYGQSENDNANACHGELIINRQYTIRLTNDYVPNMDADYRENIETTLMESIFTMTKAVLADKSMGGLSFDVIANGDTGIEYLLSENGKQEITAALNVTVRYTERF